MLEEGVDSGSLEVSGSPELLLVGSGSDEVSEDSTGSLPAVLLGSTEDATDELELTDVESPSTLGILFLFELTPIKTPNAMITANATAIPTNVDTLNGPIFFGSLAFFTMLFEGAFLGGTYAPLYGAPQFLQTFSVSYIS